MWLEMSWSLVKNMPPFYFGDWAGQTMTLKQKHFTKPLSKKTHGFTNCGHWSSGMTKSCKESLKSAKSNAWKCKMSITTVTQNYNHGVKKKTARQRQRQRQKGRQRAFSFTKEFSWMNFSHRWPLPLHHVWGILWTLWLSVCYLQSRTQDNKIVRVPLKRQ